MQRITKSVSSSAFFKKKKIRAAHSWFGPLNTGGSEKEYVRISALPLIQTSHLTSPREQQPEELIFISEISPESVIPFLPLLMR